MSELLVSIFKFNNRVNVSLHMAYNLDLYYYYYCNYNSMGISVIQGGGYSTLVWVGVCRWDFWNATHPCTHFEGKVTHPCTKNQNFSLKFAPFWRKFRKILKSWPIKVPNLRHFGANFRKFWKIDPSKYHVFEKKGPIDVPGGLILLPMFASHPYNHFCTEYPPGSVISLVLILLHLYTCNLLVIRSTSYINDSFCHFINSVVSASVD